jgi:hypothetical protein
MSFITLKSCTAFGAHQEMCDILEGQEDVILDFSFRGRHNYFVMEDNLGVKYIQYIFLIKPNNEDWAMKIVNEHEHIPMIDCPERIIKQSTLNHDVAVAWRKQVRHFWEVKSMESISSHNEALSVCLCRYKEDEMVKKEKPKVKVDVSFDEKMSF